MAHLIDSNCFIQPKNQYYGFDFCPGYWSWLDQQNTANVIFSIDKIGNELAAGNDELAEWARQKDSRFFLPIDEACLLSLREVAIWVEGAGFTRQGIDTFMKSADVFLIAYAVAHGHTIVTHEKANNGLSKVKIPNVCMEFGIPCMDIFQLLRTTVARLSLS